MAAGGGGGGNLDGGDGVLDALWRSQYGGRSQAQDPDGGTAQHAVQLPGCGPLGICAIPDRRRPRTAHPAGGSATAPDPRRLPDDPIQRPIYVDVPATGQTPDLDGYLLPGRGGWGRLQDDRDRLRAAATGPQLQVIAGGDLVRVWQPHRAHRARYVVDPVTGDVTGDPSAVRGAVVGMSFRSQRRMRDLLHTLRSDGPSPLWVTLTLPGVYPDPDAARSMFTTWVKRVSRKFPSYAGVWRIAPQRRGAAHYHLLMWGLVDDGDRLRTVKAWMAAAWHGIAGGGDAHHLQHGCTVKRVGHAAGVRRYIGKYQSRSDADLPGRSWGVMHRDLLPVGRVVTMDVPAAVARDLVRYVRRACYVNRQIGSAWVKRAPRLAADHGATRYGDPQTWLQAVAHLDGRMLPRGSDLAMLRRADAALCGAAARADLDAAGYVARGALWRRGPVAGPDAARSGPAWLQAVKAQTARPPIYGGYTPMGSQTGRVQITDGSQTRRRVPVLA